MAQQEITDDNLRQIMPRLPAARRREYLPHLNAAMREFKITNELRAAAFLAQLAHESIELTALVENMSYSASRILEVFGKYVKTRAHADRLAHNPQALANLVYGGRMGNAEAGDGYKFRGRTPTHLTGRSMYTAVSRALGVDLVSNPDQANDPATMFRVAGWFWKTNGLNELADTKQFKQITRRLNGGYNGLDSRLKYYDRALRAIPDNFRMTASAPAPDEHATLDVEPDEVAELSAPAAAPPAMATTSTGEQVPVVSASAPPVVVEATAVTKTGARKSIVAVVIAAFSTLGVGVETLYGKIAALIASGNPMFAVVVIALIAAGVVIYWKYQERQTRLDEAREKHAHETNRLAMTIASDQTKNNVVLAPNVVPADPPDEDAGDEAALTPSGARE